MDFIARAGPAVAALALSIALARSAPGQSAPPAEREKVRLVYEAPESCAAREQFLPQVRARLGSDWEAAPGELARTIHVKVSLTGERYVARIELQDARGKQVARAVAGTRCEQVIEGIALVTVLAIEAQLDELLSQSEPIPDEPVAPSAPPPAPAAPAEPAKADARAPGAPARQPPPASSSEVKLRIGARALIHDGAGPGLGTGFGAFAALVWPSVVLGLAVDAIGTGEVEAQAVTARFNLLAARLDGCGRFPVSTTITVEPCLFFQGGSLEGQGNPDPPQIARGSAGTSTWLVPGALLAVRGEFGPVLLGLEGSAGITLSRGQYYLANPEAPGGREVVYEVPWLAAGAAFSAGVTF